MGLFYKDGVLHFGSEAEHSDLTQYCGEGKPAVYIYDVDGMVNEAQNYAKAFSGRLQIHYAVKANSHHQLLKRFAGIGVGADVVSAGEAKLAIEAGIDSRKVIFSGVGKTVQEIEYALEAGLFQINVESIPELQRIAQVAQRMNKKAAVAFRFNPDVNPDTHPYITTGFRDNKFGIAREQLWEFLDVVKQNSDHLHLQGITVHIGSQLLEIESLCQALMKTKTLYKELVGQGFALSTIDIGGGVGVDYQAGTVPHDMINKYGQFVVDELSDLGAQILAEPGRVLTAIHGVLLCEVQYVKDNGFKKFVIVNTGMHHIARPSLYQAYHRILPIQKGGRPTQIYDVVGPICESSDVLGQNREMAEVQQGDWLAIAEAGAYGRVMANTYNAHDLPEEIIL